MKGTPKDTLKIGDNRNSYFKMSILTPTLLQWLSSMEGKQVHQALHCWFMLKRRACFQLQVLKSLKTLMNLVVQDFSTDIKKINFQLD